MQSIVSKGITSIRNAQMAGHQIVKFPTNKLMNNILNILRKKKYIESFETINSDKKNFVQVVLKKDFSQRGVIREIQMISKDKLRVYCSSKNIPRKRNGYATVIVSTSKGVMTGREAKEQKLGGEPICYVF